MERRAPFVLACILLFFGSSVGQDDVGTVKGRIAPGGIQNPVNPFFGGAKNLPPAATSPRLKAQAAANYSSLPLSFEPNQGQASGPVKFLSRGTAYSLSLTKHEAVLAVAKRQQGQREMRGGGNKRAPEASGPPDYLHLRLEESNPAAIISGEDALPGKSNYFIGNDSRKWHTGIPNYARVRYHNVYPGIDLVYYGSQGRLEYDFVVAPNARPDEIALRIDGAGKLELDSSGDLVLPVGTGTMRLRKPLAYQEIDGARREVAATYLVEKGRVKFRLGDYDRRRQLVIDPLLSFSTYFGGSGDELFIGGNIDGAITLDVNGNIYVAGETLSPGFAFGPFPPGGYDQGCGTDTPPTCNVPTGGPFGDLFIAKLNPTASAVLAFTYLGGSSEDILAWESTSGGLVVDATGVYVGGTTFSTDFPTTSGVFRAACTNPTACASFGDGFVSKLDVNLGSLIFSTYLSGNGASQAGQIKADSLGNVYVIGQAESGYPATSSISPCAPASTCVTGFITELNSTGTAQVFSDFLGGSGQDFVGALALDTNNNIYVAGATTSTDFPGSKTLLPASTSGGIYSSSNGTAWTALNTGLAGLNIKAVAINPSTPTTLLAGTGQGIFQSTNGGTSWALVSSVPNISSIVFDPVNPVNAYAGSSDGADGVIKSTNGGTTWAPAGLIPGILAGSAASINVVAADPVTEGVVYAGTQAKRLWKSTNGGTSWTQITSSSGLAAGNITTIVIDGINPANLYAGSPGLGVFASTNAGANWVQVNNGLTINGAIPSIRGLAIDPNNHTTLYAATSQGVFKSTNSGGAWTQASNGLAQGLVTPTIRTVAVDPSNSQNVYAGSTGGGLFFSSNGGASWTLLNNLGPRIITALALHAGTPSTIYAGTGYELAYAAKINAGGGSLAWATLLGGNAQTYLLGIALDSSNNVYLGGQTSASNFPVTATAFQKTLLGSVNGAVAKLSSSGNAIAYASYVGGSGVDAAYSIAVDSGQQAWLTGTTSSNDFPLANAVWLQNPGNNGSNEGFVTQFNAAGSGLVFSTYLGGEGNCQNCSGFTSSSGVDITVDSGGNAYVLGFTNDTSFITANAVQPASGGGYDAFITKIGAVAATTDLSICLLNSLGQCTTTPPAAAYAGTNLVLNLQVTNKSLTTTATGVVMGGRGASGIRAVACTVTIGTCAPDNSSLTIPNGGFANLGTLPPGAVALITVTLVGTKAGSFVVTADVRENETDANPADNTVSTTLTILAAADLAVTLSESPSPVQSVPANVTYTVTGTNLGPSTASNVTLVVSLSPATAVTFGTLPTGCTNTAPGVMTCSIGAMTPETSFNGPFTVTLSSIPVTATATVSNTTEGDPDLTNNTATVSTTSVERFLITDFDNNALRVFNLADSSVATAPIRGGRSATGVAVSPNRRVAFIGNLNSNYASVMDLTIGREIARIHNVRAERNLALSRDGSVLVIPDLNTNSLVIVDTATFNVIQRVPLADALGDPQGFDFLGSVVVANNVAFINTNAFNSNLPVVAVDLSRYQAVPTGVRSGNATNTASMAATPDGAFVLATRQNPNDLYIINTATLSAQTVSLPSAPLAITVVPNPTASGNTFGFLAHTGANGPVISAIDLRKGSATFGQLLANTDVSLITFGGVRDLASSSDGSRLIAILSGGGTADNVAVLDATPVRNCSNSSPACAPPTVLFHGRLGDTQSGFTSVAAAFADTVSPSTAPILSSPITPASVAYNTGTPVVITGSNFSADTMVRFGFSDPVPAISLSSTSILATVPLDAAVDAGDIIVTARNGTGAIASQNQSALLTNAITITAPSNYQPANQVVIAATGGDEVDVLNLANKDLVRVPEAIGLGDRPLSVAVTADGSRAFVTSFSSGNLDFFNLASQTQEQPSLAMIGPYGTNGGKIFGQNDAIAPTTYPGTGGPAMAILTTLPLTASTNDLQVSIVDANPSSPAFKTVINSFAAGLTNGGGQAAGGIASTPDGKFYYANHSVGDLVVFNLSNLASIGKTVLSTATLGVSAFQSRVYVTPDGNSLLLSTDAGGIAVFDISASRTNPTLVTTITGTQAGFTSLFLTTYQVVGTKLYAFDPYDDVVQIFNFDRSGNNFTQLASFAIQGEIGILGADLAVTPDGSLIYAVLEGQDRVLVLDATAMLAGSQSPIITSLATGANPIGVAISANTVAEPDLSVVIDANPGAGVGAGGFITYTMTVANALNTPATGVVLNTTLSPALTINSVTTSQGSCNASGLPAVLGSFNCNLGTINQATPATITVIAIAPASGSITATASATENEADLNPANNSASVNTPVLAAAADLAVFMSDSPHPPVVNSNYTYTITVTDLGPSPATGVVLSDTLPAGVNFVSVSGTGCGGTTTITCNIGSLGVGSSATVTVTVTPTVSTTIVDTATVSGTLPDPNPANNSYSVSSSSSSGLLLGDNQNGRMLIFPNAGNLAQSATSRTGPAPSTIVLSPNRRLAFVSNQDASYISVEDLTLQREVARIRNLWVEFGMAITPDGSTLVALDNFSAKIALINTSTFQVQTVAGTQSGPYGAVAIAGNKAYLNPLSSGTNIGVLDLGTQAFSTLANTQVGGVSFGKSIVATQGGQLVLALQQNFVSFVVQVINTNSNSVQTIPLSGFPLAIAAPQNTAAAGSTLAYIAMIGNTGGTSVSVLDLTPGSSTYGTFIPGATLNIGSFEATDASLSADGSKLYLIGQNLDSANLTRTLEVVDTAQLRAGTATATGQGFSTFLEGIAAGDIETQPAAAAPVVSSIGPGTSVTNDTANTLTLGGSNFAGGAMVRFGRMDPIAASNVTSTSLQVQLPQYAPAQGNVEVIVSNPNSSSPVESQYQSGILGNGNSGFSINPAAAFAPTNQVAISNFGDNTVSLLSPATRLTTPAGVGYGPFGIAITPDGKVAYVEDAFSGQVTVLNLATGATFTTLTFPGAISLGTIEGVTTAPDPTNSNTPIALVPLSVVSGSNIDAQLQIIDANSTSPTFNTVLRTISAGLTGNSETVGAVAASPDGKFVYVSLSDGNLLVFNMLTSAATEITGLGILTTQFHMQVTSDGKWLLTGSNTGGVNVFDLTTPTAPAPAGTITPVLLGNVFPFFTGFQASGSRVYGFSSTSNVVEAFNFVPSTTPANQNFSLLGSFAIPGNTSIFVSEMAASPDGSLIYATNQADDSVAVVSGNLLAAGNPNPLLTKVAAGLSPIVAAVSPAAAASNPDLTISKSHTGSFFQGQTGATYAIKVTNSGTAPSSGTVTVTDTIPAGLTATAIGGTGWTCPTLTSCNRSDALAAGTSYPVITLTVSVAANAPAQVTNAATVAGGGEVNTGNDSASDPTTITPPIVTACTGTTTNWLGGTGNWSDSTRWSTGVVPNSPSVNVCIADGNPVASQVTLDISAQVANLYIDSNASLIIGNGNALIPVAGTISNAGNITIAAAGNNTFLSINGAVTLTGGGALTLSTSGVGTAFINEACNCGAALTNVNNTIAGVGNIGNNGLPFTNQASGTVNANAAGTLLLNTGATSNLGTLEATGGGTLQLNGTTFVNAGGTIAATGSGSAVQLVNATVRAGTVAASGGGVLGVSNGNTGALDGSTGSGPVTVSGTYTTADNSTTVLLGTINNTGNILVSAAGNNTQLRMSGAVTLTGGGTVTLTTTGSGTPIINEDCNCGAALTNANNTIQGVGLIGNGLPLVNQPAGVINANVAGANSLVLNPGSATNQGLMTATAGGTLQLNVATFVNASGTISATGASATAVPSTVQLVNATIQGGTINTAAGGVLGTATGSNGTLDGSTGSGPVNNLGTYTSADASSTFLLGTINNTGTLLVNAAVNSTQLRINGAVTLTGGGILTLSSNGAATAIVNEACNCGAALTNASNLIQGSGEIGNNGLPLVNQATINANLPGQTLTIDGGSTTNAGVLEATGGGILSLSNNAINNQNGTIMVNGASSAVKLVNNVTIQGGTLTTANGGVLGSAAGQAVTLDGKTLGTLTNSGTYTLADGSTTFLLGTISNPGTLLVNAVSNATSLRMNGSVSLTGGGTVTLSSTNGGGTAVINEACNCGAALTNVGNVIQGAGVIGNNGLPLVNQATINATVPGQSLTINGGSTTNAGLLEATGGGTLVLSNNIINNQSGTITVNGAASNVQFVSNVTIQGGSLNTLNGGVLGASSGQTVTLDGHALGTLTNNGTFTAADGSQTIWMGTISNPGTFLVNAVANSTQLRMSGAVNLTGTGTVTLSSTANGTAIINEACNCSAALTNASNLIQGAGVIGNNGLPLLNQATINANTAGKTLTLNGGSITNAGLLEATGGGTLALSADTINNQNGAITVNGATSTLQLVNNATIQGGSLNTLNGGALGVPAGQAITLDGHALGTLTLNGTFTGADNSQTFLLGTINNLGAFKLNAVANATQLRMNGSVILTGAGSITLSSTPSGGIAYINEACNCGATLTNTSNLIQGAGVIGNNGLPVLNQAIINANVPGQTLTLNGGGLTNTGLLEATAGGLLQLNNTTFANANGTIAASGSGSTVQLVTSTIQGGTLTNSAGGVLTLPAGNSSTLDGSTANGAVNNAGALTVGDNSQLVLTGIINNTGALQVNAVANATQLRIAGAVSLTSAGTVTLSSSGGGTAIINEACNCGAILTNVGNTIQGVGVIGNNGLPVVNQGTITTTLLGGGSYTQSAGSIVVPATTVDSIPSFAISGGTAQVDGTLNSPVTISGSGTVLGSGTIGSSVNNGGVVQPGDSPGIMTVSNANYAQTAAGALNIAIAGTTVGTQYSQLHVTGTATLGGTLNVTLTNGFVPAPGNAFTILTAGSVAGTFATRNLPAIAGESWQVTYNSTSVVLTVSLALPPGTLYATGFENPPFTLGSLSGQDGWQVFGPGTVLVENTLVQSGSQAVSVSGSAASQSGPYHSDSTTGPLVELSAGIYIASSPSQSAWQFAAMGPNLTAFLGGVNITASGQIQAITAGLPNIGTWTYNNWNTVDLLLNMTAQTYAIKLNGVTLASAVPFCGDNGACAGTPVNTYGTSIFDTFGGGNDTAYIDNFSLTTPTLAITSISPLSATAGGTGFTLTVNGAGFVNGATVNFNGSARATTFVSANQLTAQILASDIATAGTFNVTVSNPPPNGATSTALTFTVNNPLPTITSLSPPNAVAGGGGFTLTVNGAGFVNNSVVNFNGSPRTTVFVSATQITASILASDIVNPGNASVTVTNPAPGGGTSSPTLFAINAPNPAPAITTISPTSALAGGAGFIMTVNGTGFVSASVVNFAGSARATTFVNATQLTAAILASDIAVGGNFSITVSTPAPGGGTSNSATFTVNNPVPTATSLSPSSTFAGGAGFILTVTGTNFVSSSTVSFNGNARGTTFVSATQVTASILASDIAAAGNASVTVANPAPGGGASNPLNFTINAVPDLTIAKSHTGDFALAQAGATYTITVSNIGAGLTSGTVTVNDNLPAGLAATAISGNGWTCPSLTSCNRSDALAPGSSYPPITLTVTVAANAPAQVTNTATVSGGSEVNLANDSVSDPTNIVAASADLATTVAVIPPADPSGTTVAYSITITNNGPSAAASVTLTDQLIGNAAFVSAVSDTMNCPAPTANVTCTLAVLNNGSSATVTITVNLKVAGWDGNTLSVTSATPDPNPFNNASLVQKQSAGGNTVTGADVAVQPADSNSSASPAVLTFADVTRGGTTTLASTASGPAPPAGFRAGTPAVFYNLSTSAGYSGAIGVALGFNGVSFHHASRVRLFHLENGAWVDRTVALNPAGGYAVAVVSSLSPIALFEPLNQIPLADPGVARVTPATSAQGAPVTLNGAASSDADGDPLTYRWTGPFPEGNGVITGVSPTVTLPPGSNQVTLVVNDGEVNSAPAAQYITVTDFTMAATATGPTTISAGSSVTFNVTASQQFGAFPPAISLACIGLPQGAQCNFSSPTASAGGSAVAMTISTTPRTTAALGPVQHRNLAPLYTLWMPVPAIVLMGLGVRLRSRKRAAALLLLLLVGMMLVLASCGGGSMVTPIQQAGTPPGTFTVTVVGTAGGTLQHTTTVSITVQ